MISEAVPRTTRGVPPRETTLAACICTRNRPDSLRRTLRSLLASSVPIEQIVVSDDSTDGATGTMVAAEFPHSTYLRGPRIGLGANRNTAVSAATATHLIFIDDDCLLGVDFVARVLETLSNVVDPDKTIVGGRETNGDRVISSSDQGFLGFQDRAYASGDVIRSVVINAALFPRAMFDTVRFDESLVYGCDEIDLTTRAVHAGFRIVNCPEAINHHHPSPVNRDYYAAHVNSARLYVTFKRYWWTESRRIKATAFLAVAVVHLVASATKEHRLAGLAAVPGALLEATTSIARHARFVRRTA